MLEFKPDDFSWFDLHWFSQETLLAFVFENKDFLWGIPFIPLLFLLRWLLHVRFRQKLQFAFPSKKIDFSWITLFRFVPDFFITLFLISLLLALARPQKTNEKTEQYSEGIDIVLALDISESMRLEDFKPNRLEAAKKVAQNFIKGRFQDRIGMVIFSGEAYALSPLTTDYNLLNTFIGQVRFKMIPVDGTAIGNALGVATNRLRESNSKSKVIILLTDGSNNAGSIDPITAAELAKAFNIKIYSIAVGKEGQVPMGKDDFGNPIYVQNTIDETALRKIASIGDGKFYRASSNNALTNIFKAIDQYEKAEIKETRFKDTKDYYDVYLIWAMVFLIIWMLLKSTFMVSALED